jgi:hypothetical protein
MTSVELRRVKAQLLCQESSKPLVVNIGSTPIDSSVLKVSRLKDSGDDQATVDAARVSDVTHSIHCQ